VIRPLRVAGTLSATQKITLLIHVIYQRIGVITFMAYAFPAIFDMLLPLLTFTTKLPDSNLL
jgi:hypothetical protein